MAKIEDATVRVKVSWQPWYWAPVAVAIGGASLLAAIGVAHVADTRGRREACVACLTHHEVSECKELSACK